MIADAPAPLPGPKSLTLNLFLISVLGLFTELMLIRWIGTEIRIFAYLQNTILVVCFLGLGMGCWTCHKPAHFRMVLLPLAALIAILSVPWVRLEFAMITPRLSLIHLIWDYSTTESSLFKGLAVAFALVQGFALMLLIWITFVPVGRILGRALDNHPRPILAYSANIAGSLVGILLYVLLCAVSTTPLIWCAVFAVIALCYLERPWLLHLGLLAGIVAVSHLASAFPDTRTSTPKNVTETPIGCWWSPYQKLFLIKETRTLPEGDHVMHTLYVNNCPYMALLDLRPEATTKLQSWYDPALTGLSQYDLPTLLQPKPGRMLIVGSGGGNDVAGGLRGPHAAEAITAVEIDPAIIRLGKEHHPEQPYQSPKVTVVNDDARAFFMNTDQRFDLIVFGLLDSHTTTAMTNARLDHYVYTEESLAQAKRLLNPGGVVVLSFEAQKPFIADRINTSLKELYNQEPLVVRVPVSAYGYGGFFFVVGDLDGVRARIEAQPRLQAFLDGLRRDYPIELPGTTRTTTDDWPYIYLETAHVPPLYFLLAVLLVVLFGVGNLLLGSRAALATWRVGHLHFFFLGAAFLLLEVQNISKAAVVLGNTWDVNAVIIASIMIIILVANLIAATWPRLPLGLAYVGLIGSAVGLYFVDLAWFGGLPYLARAAIVGLLTSLPMLFSGIVFIRSFATFTGKDVALGANLFGALIGGLLQSLTFVTGIKALLLIVAGLYAAAWATRPRSAGTASTPPP
ncbi:MAG TPA: methyltransferase domain-containing protein [Gemmatales bacterium]|nr:methyltransferase domain-containing protein [Gemmatales bacterium]